MENSTVADQIVLMKVRDICCAPHLKQLKKEISKLDGVFSVYVDPKKDVIVVTCKEDTKSALEAISKSGKFEEVVCYYHNPNHDQGGETENSCGVGRYKAGGGERKHRCEVYTPSPPYYYSSSHYPPSSHNYYEPMPRNSGYPPRQPSYAHRPFDSPLSWFGFS